MLKKFLTSRTYIGPERRRRRVYVTANSEYHLYDKQCVAVRKRSGTWFREHHALGRELTGLMDPEGYLTRDTKSQIAPGWRLRFSNNLLTSPLRSVQRPHIDVLRDYERFGFYDDQPQ